MEIKTYIAPLLKYWWLILMAGIVAAMASFLVVRRQPPIYQTKVTLVFGRAVYDPNPTGNDLYLDQQLAAYYANIAQREQVRNATMAALGLDWLPQYMASALPNSQMIEIDVIDTDPGRAQLVANELANQLVLQTPAYGQSRLSQHQDFINQQIQRLESNITDTEDQIVKKQEVLSSSNSAREIADAQQAIDTLQSKLVNLQNTYASLLVSTDRGANNTLTIIEPAAYPTEPIGPNKTMIILLATMISIVVASGSAYLLEYLDDTLKYPEDVRRLLPYPVLGHIAEMKWSETDGVYVARQPRSVIADAFRSLRINLEFAGIDRPLQMIYISSPGAGDGKTSIAANLATVIAQGGKKVILLDADMRQPKVHTMFNLTNEKGLSDVFRKSLDLWDVIVPIDDYLSVIPCGNPPPNPTDLLGSQKMDSILEDLVGTTGVIIIDGPPLLVAEAAVLARKVDGVLIVVRHGYTHRRSTQASVEQLQRANAHILGVVVNRLSHATEGYYQMREYYTDPTKKSGPDAVQSKANGRWAGLLPRRRKPQAVSNPAAAPSREKN
jgi:succinoglycan biosynthesis transport protein ExoP